MQTRLILFGAAALAGGVLGYAWNLPLFSQAYKSFIALFADPEAPLGGAWAVILLAFVIGVPRICVP
ncbi:MAG: hypothetical protein ACREJV_05475 [Candidatus Rokuibacteriota bacterium]